MQTSRYEYRTTTSVITVYKRTYGNVFINNIPVLVNNYVSSEKKELNLA